MDNFVTDTVTSDFLNESTSYNNLNTQHKVNIQELIHKISKLNLKEKEHILKLFIDKKIEYTKNVNGYFFNLSSNNVTEEILQLIENGINLMEKNRNLLNDIDKKRDLMLKECKESIENELNNTIKIKKEEYYKKIKNVDIDTNIHYTFEKIKRKIFAKLNEYNIDNLDKKTIVYNKNSVYFRMNNIMKLLTRKNKSMTIEYYDYGEYNDENDYIDNNGDDNEEGDVHIDDDNGIVDYQIADDNDIIEDDMTDNKKNNLHDENDNDDDHDMLDIDDPDLFVHEDSHTRRRTIEEDKEDTHDTDDIVDDKEKLFYKQLLNKHGFTFNEDKICFLLYQKYLL